MVRKRSANGWNSTASQGTDNRLKLYALAAAAASVSMLALAEPAEGKVIITNTNIPLPGNGTFNLDLNGDGVTDVVFSDHYYHGKASYSRFFVNGGVGGGIQGTAKHFYASALMRSAKIGPSAKFSGTILEQQSCGTNQNSCHLIGKWGANHPNRFLGVKFLIHGNTHYGWVRVTVTAHLTQPLTATITEYGYETIANKRVLAGVPSNNADEEVGSSNTSGATSLGMLAAGADGLALWRREN